MKATTTPDIAAPLASRTSTDNCTGNAVPGAADWPSPLTMVRDAGVPLVVDGGGGVTAEVAADEQAARAIANGANSREGEARMKRIDNNIGHSGTEPRDRG